MSPEARLVVQRVPNPGLGTQSVAGAMATRRSGLPRGGSCYPGPATFCDTGTRALVPDFSISPQKAEMRIFFKT